MQRKNQEVMKPAYLIRHKQMKTQTLVRRMKLKTK